MQNYKVEVKNHGESIEAQELFFNLGYSWFHKKFEAIEIKTPETIMCFENGALTTGIRGSAKHKQITLPELRAMVSVQKYEELAKKYDGVKTKQLPNGIQFKKSKTSVTIYPSTGTIVSDVCGKINVLKKAGIGKLDYELNKHFSVITPKQKEYLVKTNTGYTLQVLSDVVDGHDGIIEVPEGANKYIQSIKYPERFGFLRNESFWDNKWIKHCDKRDDYIVLWQRESLNDQVASAEKARQEQAQVRELSECDFIDSGKLIIGGLGESFPVGLEHHKFIQPEELPFVSDNAWNNQIGGDHYKKLAIQPMEYALQNKLDYAQANVVKYVTRHADKNGKADLLKAKHCIDLMIAHYYSDQE